MHKLLVILFIFLSLTCSFHKTYAQNQVSFPPPYQLAYDQLIQLKLNDATEILKANTKNAQGITESAAIHAYLQSYLSVLQLLASQEDSLYQAKKAEEDTYLEKVKLLDKKSPLYLFLQAEIKLHWALVGFMFGENFSSAWAVKQAYHLLEKNQQLFPHFVPTKKSLGILHLALGSVPEKYQWLLQLIGLEGNMKLGLAEMREVIAQDSLYALETKMLMMLAQTYILHEPAKALAENQATNTHSLLFCFIYNMINLKAERVKENDFIQQHQKMLESNTYLYSPFFDYLKGEIALLSGNYEQASTFYQDFLKNFKGKNYIKSAYYRLFLANWLADKPQASQYLALCLKNGQTQIEADKSAENFAENFAGNFAGNFTKNAETGILPNKKLMQARLFTDGGLYELAWQKINQLQENQLIIQKEKIEFYYRKARILDKQGRHKDAASFYTQTISLSANLPYYFAPNAALQLGYLYRDTFKDTKKAKSYFQKVLTYPKHEYKNSLDHKAKTALKKLSERE